MTRLSEIAESWFGLCRKPPVVRTLQADFVHLPTTAHEGLPDGGSGGTGAIRRGIGAAFSGMRTLNRNRQLLWFGLLAGLVLAGNAVGEGALRYINRTLQPDIIGLYAQDFFLGFATLFCLVLLLAGLFLSLSSMKEGAAPFFEGFAGAKKYWKPLFLWSIILALAGILLLKIFFNVILVWFPQELGFLYHFGPGFITSTITQFPFNWTLDWAMLTEIPGYGGRSLLLWIYPFGLLQTLDFLMIALFLVILTPFVVPLIVLEQKTLREAVAGSFALIKKIGAEAVTCAAFLGIVLFGVFLTHLIVQAASGIVNPYVTVMFHPTTTWIAIAILYNLALVAFVFVVATVGGIAALDLYRHAKSEGSAG
ncbi:hypothetical protein [Methanoregula sp.]|uniref:hypothetical protein n=1 Tax=Methanoregula sp. TaxID=2052170 RepID=UPI00260301DB|nr:hypothetical protein [Methanoregula sp.]MDD5143918.1 hypothetical protein [Methanoregula sp.]